MRKEFGKLVICIGFLYGLLHFLCLLNHEMFRPLQAILGSTTIAVYASLSLKFLEIINKKVTVKC